MSHQKLQLLAFFLVLIPFCAGSKLHLKSKDNETLEVINHRINSLHSELQAVQGSLRTVTSELESCLESHNLLRKAENDHVVVHRLQEELLETKDELKEISEFAQSVAEGIRTAKREEQEEGRLLRAEMEALRREMQEMRGQRKQVSIVSSKGRMNRESRKLHRLRIN